MHIKKIILTPFLFTMVATFAAFVTWGCSSKKSGSDADGSVEGDSSLPVDGSPNGDEPDGRIPDGGETWIDAGQSVNDCTDPHPSWLFCEDFEYGNGDYDTWFEHSGFLTAVGGDDRGRIDLSNVHAVSGEWSIYMPASAESGHRGADLVWYACDGEQRTNCPLLGYERLYFRTMIRFAEDHSFMSHFLSVSGLDRFWAYGSSGCLPNGVSSMGTTVDFDRDTHETFFYTYYLDMGCDTNCGNYMNVSEICAHCDNIGFPTCDEQEQCCWGNRFRPTTPAPLPVGEWFCFEMMMEANTPGEGDGKMAYWINGQLGHNVETMRWRTTDSLQLNRVKLQHYIPSTDRANRVWFDDVVVSTKRIGCP